MPRVAEVVLANWREVERRLAETEAGTSESEWLQAEAARLRDEYQGLLEALRESQEATGDDPFGHARAV
jgi:hypothetical protein